MLGSMLTKEEVEEFMREADVVSLGLKCQENISSSVKIFVSFPLFYILLPGWKW